MTNPDPRVLMGSIRYQVHPMRRQGPGPIVATLVLGWSLAVSTAQADITLSGLFKDHMVLQRGIPAPVWGRADPGETVTVRIAGQEKSAAAGADGRWEVRLDPLDAGGPHAMTVSGRNTLQVGDVLVGEVWLAAGQSNMVMALKSIEGGPGLIETAACDRIRLFEVERFVAPEARKPAGRGSTPWPSRGPGCAPHSRTRRRLDTGQTRQVSGVEPLLPPPHEMNGTQMSPRAERRTSRIIDTAIGHGAGWARCPGPPDPCRPCGPIAQPQV